MKMTGNRVLLDTNAYSNLLRGNTEILDYIKSSSHIYFSIFVIAELLAGFKGGTKENNNVEVLNNFLSKSKVEIVNANYETANIFAQIKSELKTKGTPIPINDIWIAAHTIQTNSTLISKDKHFNNIDNITIFID